MWWAVLGGFFVSYSITSLFHLVKLEHNSNLLVSYHKLEMMKKKDENNTKKYEELQDKLLSTPHFKI